MEFPNNILLCAFLVSLSALFFSSAADYSLPEIHFINCGSTSKFHAYQVNFTGDQNSGNYVDSTSAADQSLQLELYRTARIFRKTSFYELDLEKEGTYVLRLHFFPFPSLGNLADARFHVSASKIPLLSNFTVPNGSFPLVEEFLIRAAAGKKQLEFRPDGRDGSFAFVNAIEVFMAPPELLQNTSLPLVSRQGSDGSYDGVNDSLLRVVHRINVGGRNVTRDVDTLMRFWIPDDAYLLLNNTAAGAKYDGRITYQSVGATRYDGRITYQSVGATRYVAPDPVY